MYKHRLKKRIFQNGQYRDIIIHTNARFGSCICDKYGQEIFEGDTVKWVEQFGEGRFGVFTVIFYAGSLVVDFDGNGDLRPLYEFFSSELEVIEDKVYEQA